MSRTAVFLALLLAGCSELYYLELPDVNLEAPDDLSARAAEFKSGADRHHGDPRAVADRAIRRHVDVPWKADPYKPSLYELKESAEWGQYVTRGYVYPSGHVMRYRVKVRKHQDIWYVVQISRYKVQELDPLDGQGHQH